MKKRYIILSGMILLILICIGSVFLLQKDLFIEKIQIKTPTKELNAGSTLIQELYTIANPSNDGAILKELYDDGQADNGYILAMGAMNYIRKNISINDPMVQNMMFTATISKEELKQSIYEILGEIPYEDESFYVLNPDYGVCGFTYQPEVERYVSLNGCGGSNTETFLRKVLSARQEENYIYILEKSIYVYNDWDEYISRNYIYKDCNKNEMIDYQETESTESKPLSIENYLDKAATYEYVFENNNGQYIFKGLRKI